MSTDLLVATHNPGKVRQLASLLEELDVRLVSLEEAGIDWDVEETGETFEENAILKAQTYAGATGLLTLADDSGLEVDALGGKPGVRTSRYGGKGLDSAQRYMLLLEALNEVPWEERTARFRSVVALADAGGVLATAAGTVEGRIALAPAGSGGFGYDPVFYLDERKMTLAELPPGLKNRISHRARAVEAIRPKLAARLAT
jgi:XTP/dITP diphosphohydrolase